MSTRIRLYSDDYQVPLTSESLLPNSKWLIVRRNLHKIRRWGNFRRTSIADQPFRDWYLFYQMKRELKRAEEEIRAMQNRTNFTPVKHFDLAIDHRRVRRYNVSHVRPSDGIYYGGLGAEPISLENLLYYFSKECVVPYNSIFYSFLSDVSSVLDTNRQRLRRVAVYRKVALIFALAVDILMFIMFFSMMLSLFTTIWKFKQTDENMEWNSINRA